MRYPLLLQAMLLALGVTCLPARADDIPGSCLASFNVKDKIFVSGTQTFSCRQLEVRRTDLFKTINGIPGSGTIDVAPILKEMQAAQDRIKKVEGEKNWADVAEIVGGHFLATVGLIGCAESAGLGCALAVVGKAMAMEQTVRMAVNDTEKAAEAQKLRAQIAAWQQKIKGMNPEGSKVRPRLVEEFTGMCMQVKSNCL